MWIGISIGYWISVSERNHSVFNVNPKSFNSQTFILLILTVTSSFIENCNNYSRFRVRLELPISRDTWISVNVFGCPYGISLKANKGSRIASVYCLALLSDEDCLFIETLTTSCHFKGFYYILCSRS